MDLQPGNAADPIPQPSRPHGDVTNIPRTRHLNQYTYVASKYHVLNVTYNTNCQATALYIKERRTFQSTFSKKLLYHILYATTNNAVQLLL